MHKSGFSKNTAILIESSNGAGGGQKVHVLHAAALDPFLAIISSSCSCMN